MATRFLRRRRFRRGKRSRLCRAYGPNQRNRDRMYLASLRVN
ncbi:hypothetical protein C791_2602 [Amycolatopsis azurea DSM 43854]|uniref:Uncharacterized protein n=1 Tax=Amycolatopsis azurea DSM 43854 TaxID=1238180 RepID=M2NWX6_9PSEU|nr:hypothetical protein C791_2602 [Amycolatopsis azurea DSM 43854]